MITTVIVDDEQHCIDRLSGLLAQQFSRNIQVIGVFSAVDDALDGIKKLHPGLVFLDVQINDKTGFDLLLQSEHIDFEVIFTTAYDKYAVQAFKFSAIDYLLKPVEADDLKAALDKLNEKISKNDKSKKIEALLNNIQSASKRICVPVVNGLVFLQIADVIRCQSEVNYTNIFLKDKQKLLVAKTLKEFEEMLADYNFFRIHNSHLINLAYIKSYNKGKGGYVTMMDNSSIEVASRRKDEFLKKLLEV
jgi:two-component system, LytTR family, response regulator